MKKKPELPKVEPVKIKPLFGIKPNIWVTACYGLAVLILIFIIAFLPGIKKGQKRVTFTSAAGNVAVYVDSKYVGGTPFTSFISSGNHTAEFKVCEETIDTVEFKVGHPVFLTWLFPRKMNVESKATISNTAYDSLSKAFLENVATYSAILSYDTVYQYPPLFKNYAESLKSYAGLAGSDYKDVLFAACSFITTNEMLEDAKSAYLLLSIDFDWTEIENAVKNKDFKNETEHLIGLSRVYRGSLDCEYFTRGGNSVNGFTFDDYAVSEAMYYYFVKENPNWAASNKENLINQGLVDSNYLEGVSLSSINTLRPVRNISYYAAKAFCEWLSKKTSREVFLPEELQWTTAANFSDSGFQKTLVPEAAGNGPTGVLGSVWEITSTPYIPLLSLFDYSVYNTLEKYNANVEVIVKGGSYVSDSTINTYSIGTTSLDLCSDFMGFRIAWR